ncbi:MAG: secretin N-terminal domain-containing protein, partial [Limisphaerales bacterium]
PAVRAAVRPMASRTAEPVPVVGEGESGLRLNFRGAPLEMVLDYLSEAAGFIIILETEVKGKLDVWSNQPLNREEAVELLNRVLNKDGRAAIRDGRTLTIVSRDEAKKRDMPVNTGNDPSDIPRTDSIVTQIIPVRFINAVQLTRDLQALMPPNATVAANEGGNAIVVTDTQTNIRRLAEIIRALDTAINSVSAVRVFPLTYADAKSLATVVRDLFQNQDAGRTGNNQQQQRQFQGRGGPPGFAMPGGANQATSTGGARVSAPRVVAVADERSNSLVVSAPSEQMPIIEELVKQVDTNVTDVTELRVFRLKHADPQETADLLASLFPDNTSSQTGRGQVQFGGGRFGGAMACAGTQPSVYLQKQTKVLAVPDLRTGSVVVSASRDLMAQIAPMVEQLDEDPARVQKVHVFSVENTDPQVVEDILNGMFQSQNTRNRTTQRNTGQAGNQLNNRANTTQNQQRTTGGTTGFGGTTGRTGR